MIRLNGSDRTADLFETIEGIYNFKSFYFIKEKNIYIDYKTKSIRVVNNNIITVDVWIIHVLLSVPTKPM